MKVKNNLLIAFLSLILISCSSVNEKKDYTVEKYSVEENSEKPMNKNLTYLYGEDDPLGSFNRRMYAFNSSVDRNILKPVITKYEYYTPNFFQEGVSNFFDNISNITVALNSFLQLKFTQGMETVLRFGINSTVGILGWFDVASKIGIPEYYETFGLTMAHYGVGKGAYVVAPLIGPTNFRNLSGLGVDGYAMYKVDIYHPVNEEAFDVIMTALYGFSTKVDSGVYFGESDYIFEYEYMRLLSNKYFEILEKRTD